MTTLILCILITKVDKLNYYLCMCSDKSHITNKLFVIPPRILIILIEISFFLFYSKEFLRLKVEMKYYIRCELISAATIWISMRIILLVQEWMASCLQAYPVDFLTNIPEIMVLVLFTNIIVIPLCLIKRYSNEGPSPSYSLIHSFPEALYFWTPNHYFSEYL